MTLLQQIFSITRNKDSNGQGYKLIKVLGFNIKLYNKFDKIYAKRFDGLNQTELEFCVKHQYKSWFGQKLNLDNPQTFNEKLMWIKCFYWDPLMTVCADKVKARSYFCDKTKKTQKYLVKQYGVYTSPDEIDFDQLPDSFVLKSNWGSGQQIIVKNKKDLNTQEARQQMKKWMQRESNHYFFSFEHGYRHIEPRIVCEEFLDYEYKLEFFCFNGKPRFFWIVINDKTSDVHANFYELDWKQMPVSNHYPNFDDKITPPLCYDEILENAKKMCGKFPFVRCDFYITPDGYRFSEMTFFHWGASQRFEPAQYDKIIGDMMSLPKTKINVADC